jgi:hypothetical protein
MVTGITAFSPGQGFELFNLFFRDSLRDESGEVLKDPGGAIASLLATEDDQPQ